MPTLIGDRFLLCGTSVPDRELRLNVIDLGTGQPASVSIAPSGTAHDKVSWIESCAHAYAEGRLLDFGWFGRSYRFEAYALDDGTRCARPASESLLAWLEHARPSSARILHMDTLPDPRDVRLRGFVPCDVSLFHDSALSVSIWSVLTNRSVVLLDAEGDGSRTSLAILRLRALNAREVCVLSSRARVKHTRAATAAEGRPLYGRRSSPPDGRTVRITAEADRLLLAGRHAAAERTFRSVIGALERRGDWSLAGNATMGLGRLLLARGRPDRAGETFDAAHNYFQRVQSASRALDATIFAGLAQTDAAALNAGEHTCRAAYSAAMTLRTEDSMLFAGNALARNLMWQGRHADARAILESITPTGETEQCIRYWSLMARLQIAANALIEARQALERARPMTAAISPGLECGLRRWEATIQAHVGDVDALRLHIAAGLTAARAARLPVETIKLKLVHVEGLIRAGRLGIARGVARHLHRVRERVAPALLRRSVECVMVRLERAPEARETAAVFRASRSSTDDQFGDVDRVRDLVTIAHNHEDETAVLGRAAEAIRKHTHATGVAIFGTLAGNVWQVGCAGSASEAFARRAVNLMQPLHPQRVGGWIEAAVPVEYLGRAIGAIVFRWSLEGPDSIERVIAFGLASAAVCGPLLYVLVERRSAPVEEEGSFDILGISAAISEVRKAIARAASAPFTVLIEGESGSGKELVARAIHRAGCRRERRFCALNCAAMPEDLVDAELFGHAKGAFTGATGERLGLFESADGGTVFLDEVGELSARAQAKVLRVLQEGEVRRIGEHFTRPFDARLIAATNRPLRAEVDAQRFRQDLLYRLDVIRIDVPPLRHRAEDIPLVAARFWKLAADRIGSKAVLGQAAHSALARYDWPGNVRELQNVLAALAVAAPRRGVVGASQLPPAIARVAEPEAHESLESARLKFEQRFVRDALARAAGHRGRAAAALGLSRQGLAKLMQRLHLDV